jgi:hypothetical protein
MDQRRRRLRRRHLAHGELRAWGLEVLVVLETEPLLLLLLLMQLLEGILFGLFVDCVGAVRTYFGAPKHMCELQKRRRSSFVATTDFSSGSPSPSREVGSVVICGGPIVMLGCCFLGAKGMLLLYG